MAVLFRKYTKLVDDRTGLRGAGSGEPKGHEGLADIEGGFRVLKSEIEIAPVEHRVPGRIRAHISICFPALVIHRVMRWTIKEKGCPFSPEYVLEKLKAVQHHRHSPATGVSSEESP